MLSTTAEYQCTELLVNKALPKGLDQLVHGIAGRIRRLKNPAPNLARLADRVLEESEQLRKTSDNHLRKILSQHRREIRRERADPVLQVQAALPALVEASWRLLKMRPYREQIMGMLALQDPNITEMATGEGKTLTIALAGVTAGWTQLPCHIVTANDYLAERDARTMGPLYEFCGVSVGAVPASLDPAARLEIYRRDVVYTTSKELVADFLRDRLRLKRLHPAAFRAHRKLANPQFDAARQLLQRGLHTTIIDEADNLLIDEAGTPLIISRRQENKALVSAIHIADKVARTLQEDVDYTLDIPNRRVELKATAKTAIREQREGLAAFYREASWLEELLEKALTARAFFIRDKQYVVQDEEIIIVDDFTGRLMQGRSWKQGLQQAIEAKEGIPITDPTESVASLSFQRFFRFFRKISGITGTAKEAAAEFWEVYNLRFIRIPRHLPSQRLDAKARIYRTKEQKFASIVDEISSLHAQGRPVLVGTRSIRDSVTLSEMVSERGMAHRLLNASLEREEARIIALAGHLDGITIATNMAGRGTDIKPDPEVIALGGLHVIATEMNESGRIDRQLYGRAGRQGDPGSSSTHISLEDELFPQHAPLLLRLLKTAHTLPFPLRTIFARVCVHHAQRRAERKAFRQRKAVMRRDNWLEDTFALSGLEIGN
jgi:preprotein translocase subunit SecA